MGGRTLSGEIGGYLTAPESRRAWSLAAQDGIISTAGILLGFAGAGVSEATLLIAGKAAIVAGMLTAGGAKWSETAAEREAELSAIADVRRELREQRDVERDELIAHYCEKGLDAALAAEVADRLMIRSPLKAALESQHGIVRRTSAADVAISGVGSAGAFGLGAAIPFAIAYYLPVSIQFGVILFSVAVSLMLISVVGAKAGHMNVRRTMVRTLLVALVTIAVSYVVGDVTSETGVDRGPGDAPIG